jgi:hypothetical protein
MPILTFTLTDTEFAILKTHLLDPEAWIKNVLDEKLRNCTDRIFESTTGLISSDKALSDKITELDKYKLELRTESDMAPILKHSLKAPK